MTTGILSAARPGFADTKRSPTAPAALAMSLGTGGNLPFPLRATTTGTAPRLVSDARPNEVFARGSVLHE